MNGYLFWTYAPASLAEIANAEDRLELVIPEPLKSFYGCSNGADLFGIVSIEGCVAQVSRDPENPQPIDLFLSNVLRPPEAFIFGTMTAWSARAKLGMWPNGEVRLIDEKNLDVTPKTWASFDEFMFSELDRLSALHDDQAKCLATYAQHFPPEAEYLEAANPNGRPDYGMG